MKTIWKYRFSPAERVSISVPEGAEPLHVGVQGGVPCIWFAVDTDAAMVTRSIGVFGTGHALPSDVGPHLGTFLLAEGALVFHVFDYGES